MNYNEKSFVWLTDFFEIIFKQLVSDYVNTDYPHLTRTKNSYLIKELIKDCTRLVCKESIPYEIRLYLVRQIF